MVRLERVVQRVPALVRNHLPGGGGLEHLDVRFAGEAIRHDAKEQRSRVRAPESVELNEGVGFDVELAIYAPEDVASDPGFRRVFGGVSRLVGCGRPEVE